jgi:hypothetical protein
MSTVKSSDNDVGEVRLLGAFCTWRGRDVAVVAESVAVESNPDLETDAGRTLFRFYDPANAELLGQSEGDFSASKVVCSGEDAVVDGLWQNWQVDLSESPVVASEIEDLVTPYASPDGILLLTPGQADPVVRTLDDGRAWILPLQDGPLALASSGDTLLAVYGAGRRGSVVHAVLRES